MPPAGASASPASSGTSIVGIFGMGFATTGLLGGAGARRRAFRRCRRASRPSRARAISRAPRPTVELVADRATRRLLGGSVIGEEGAAGRINVIATALQTRMRVDDFEQLDLAYSPPFAPVWDPLLIAAQQLLKELAE